MDKDTIIEYLKWIALIFISSLAIVTVYINFIKDDALARAITTARSTATTLEQKTQVRSELEKEISEIEKKLSEQKAEVNKLKEEAIHGKVKNGGNFKLSHGGIDDFLKVNGAEFVKEAGDAFRVLGAMHNIKPEMLVCIAQADSSLGNALKTAYNIGNIGNTDSGNTVHYSNLEKAIDAMGKALNNQYMGGNTILGQLSQGGRDVIKAKYPCSKAFSPYKCYASSKTHWNNNTKLCLRNILQDDTIDEKFNYKK